MRIRTPINRANQKGIALLVSMVLIFVMSILGLSAMRSATMEGRMVANSYQKDMTLQAAESASDDVIANDATIEAAICSAGDNAQNLPNLSAGNKLTTESTIVYGGGALVQNYSLDSAFGAVKFIAGGSSTITGTNTTSRVSQGIYLIGPSQIDGGCS